MVLSIIDIEENRVGPNMVPNRRNFVHCKSLAIHDSTSAAISNVAFQPLDEASLEAISPSPVKHTTEGDLADGSINVISMSSRHPFMVCRSPFLCTEATLAIFHSFG